MSGTGPAIGIDLGTTHSCVAVWHQGKVEIIPCSQGKRTTPSFVAFTESERLFGDRAENLTVLNPKNTIFNAKRIIGRRFDDPAVEKNMKRWPFTVINDASRPKFQVEFRRQQKILAPEEISAMVLTRMKGTAEAYLGTNITDVVITVPASFNNSQRQATKNAGAIAGLNVLRIINEPTAAALAYGLNKSFRGLQNVLVFDLGGGNLDVSILNISDGPLYEVLSTSGNPNLGGEDFKNRLLNHLLKEFERTHSKDISGNLRALRRLDLAAERAKRILSSAAEADIELEDLDSGIDFHTKVSRDKFEQLCIDLFRSTWIPVEKALVDAKLAAVDINEIVLVGGSTRIPKIRSLLLNFFPGKPLSTSINPDEAVACGAAIQAAKLTRPGLENLILKDITPLSLGIQTNSRFMSQLILERNSRIPCSHSKTFTTHSDHQNRISITVYEGESLIAKANNCLGKFELTGIPPLPKGVPQIEVRFNMDANGILNLWTTDSVGGNAERLVLTDDESRLTREEIKKMTEEAERYREADEEQKMKAAARNNLEAYIFKVKREVEEAGSKLSERERKFCLRECEDTLEWLDEKTYKPEAYEDELRIFILKCDPVLWKLRDTASESTSAAGCYGNYNN